MYDHEYLWVVTEHLERRKNKYSQRYIENIRVPIKSLFSKKVQGTKKTAIPENKAISSLYLHFIST